MTVPPAPEHTLPCPRTACDGHLITATAPVDEPPALECCRVDCTYRQTDLRELEAQKRLDTARRRREDLARFLGTGELSDRLAEDLTAADAARELQGELPTDDDLARLREKLAAEQRAHRFVTTDPRAFTILRRGDGDDRPLPPPPSVAYAVTVGHNHLEGNADPTLVARLLETVAFDLDDAFGEDDA